MSKSDTAVAAILALAIDDHEHDALADLLRPLVTELPPQRESDEESEWTPAEGACADARRFVDLKDSPSGIRDPWMALQEVKDRLRAHQRRHREIAVERALGPFDGYTLRLRHYVDNFSIQIWRVTDSVEFSAPFLTLPENVTRREAHLAVKACDHGYWCGLRTGENVVRSKMREALGLE